MIMYKHFVVEFSKHYSIKFKVSLWETKNDED